MASEEQQMVLVLHHTPDDENFREISRIKITLQGRKVALCMHAINISDIPHRLEFQT
jgi:hypothetical protein